MLHWLAQGSWAVNVVGVVKEVPQGVNLVVGLMCVADLLSGSNLGNAQHSVVFP